MNNQKQKVLDRLTSSGLMLSHESSCPVYKPHAPKKDNFYCFHLPGVVHISQLGIAPNLEKLIRYTTADANVSCGACTDFFSGRWCIH